MRRRFRAMVAAMGGGAAGLPSSFSPTFGAERLPNPGFEGTYTAGLANNWTKQGGTVSEETTIIHGGSKSQKVISAANGDGVYKSVAPTLGNWYQISYWLYVGSGSAKMDNASPSYIRPQQSITITDTGSWISGVLTFRAVGTGGVGPWYSAVHPATFYCDDASYKQIDLASMFSTYDPGASDIHLSVAITLPLGKGTQAGIVARLNDAATPTDFILAYIDGEKIWLDKCVSGVYTNLLNSAITYGDGKVLELDLNGTNAFVKYDGVQIGATQTVPASSDTLAGEFTTYEGNIFSGWSNGNKWPPYSGNPILSPVSPETLNTFGSVVKVESTYHMYYTYNPTGGSDDVIGHATSTDGKTFTKDVANNPVLSPGAVGKFDDAYVYLPRVWKEGATWYMLYAGVNTGNVTAIGLASSSDGITWTKLNSGDPILEGDVAAWDETYPEPTSIIKIGSTYYLWYDTNAPTSAGRQTGLATSTNLLGPWTKDPSNPIFDSSNGGVFCVDVFKYGSYYYCITPRYSPKPNVFLDLYRDTDPTFYSGSRELLGTVKYPGPAAWDAVRQDTPWVLTDDVTRTTFDAAGGLLWVYYAGGTNDSVWGMGLLIANPDLAL